MQSIALGVLVVVFGEWGLAAAFRQQRLRANASTVDLVVERHCENLNWLDELSQEIRPRLRVFIYDKPGETTDKRVSGRECKPVDAATLPADLHVTVKELKNVARDGHDQLEHIIEHYGGLGNHVAFVQAGMHWTLKSLGRKAKGWRSQAHALNELVPTLTDDVLFFPLIQHTARGPVQWRDQEDNAERDNFDKTNVNLFQTGWSDMYMRAREFYSMLFGGSPCDAPPQSFYAGMQYIVHRDNLQRRSLKFWKAFQNLLVTCDPDSGYAFERVTKAIYNSTVAEVDPDKWKMVTFCTKGVTWSGFSTPLNRIPTAKFWRKRWGCEPLSQRFLQLHPDAAA